MDLIVTTLQEYCTAIGLLLNLGGAMIVALAQSRVTSVVNTWLTALDMFVETYLDKPGPVIRFEGMRQQMEKALTNSRAVSALGWALICFGYALQIPAALE